MGNTQCISAVGKGHSKKLRHLQRTHRASLVVFHELLENEEALMTIENCETSNMLGGSFTKALPLASFIAAGKAMGIQTLR